MEKIDVGVVIKPKKNKNPKSRIKWGLSLPRAPLFPCSLSSHSIILSSHSTILFGLHLSSLPYYSPLHAMLLLYFLHCYFLFCVVVALFFALLFSFSPCYSLFHATTLLIALLLSSLRCLDFLFMLLDFPLCVSWLSPSYWCFFLRLLLYFRCKVFHIVALLFMQLCCHLSHCYCWCVVIHWRILYYLPTFFLVGIGRG